MKNSCLFLLAALFGFVSLFNFVSSKSVRPSPMYMGQHPDSHVRIHNISIPPALDEQFANIKPIRTGSQYHQLIQPYVRAPYGWIIEVEDSTLTWEVAQEEYARLLEPVFFEREDKPHTEPLDINIPYEVAAWKRTRFFNMIEDNFGMVWVENGQDDPHLLLFYQYDYNK